MPAAAPRPCVRCGVLVHGGSRCAAHQVREGSFGDLRRGSRHQRGYGSQWVKTRERIMKRDAGVCQLHLQQGIVHAGHEVDHRVPKAQGGTDEDSNLWCICREAHQAKTAREGGGRRISGGQPQGTGGLTDFSRAQVSGRGGDPWARYKGGA